MRVFVLTGEFLQEAWQAAGRRCRGRVCRGQILRRCLHPDKSLGKTLTPTATFASKIVTKMKPKHRSMASMTYDFTFLVWLHFSQHHGFHWRWGNTLVVLLCIDSYTTTKASLCSYVALVRAEDEVEILLVLALGLVLTHIFYKQPSHCFLLMVSMYSQKC